MLQIVVAPNAFKHSLDASEAAEAIRMGLESSELACHVICHPIGDGGDGMCQLIHRQLNGRQVTCEVPDPIGRTINASYSLIRDGHTAVIEMADTSGIRLLSEQERRPMITSSRGTGEMLKHALDRGVKHIMLGMGGSATVDGGCGMLHALGVRFLNKSGDVLKPTPKELMAVEHIDLEHLDKRLQECEITIMCDVTNKLLGEEGAATVFGPQKGATPREVNELEVFLKKLSSVVFEETGKDMAAVVSGGAAGGASAGMFALADARLVKGIAFFLELTGFENTLSNADWVITGEGSMDEQTLGWKGPYGVAVRAKQKGIPVIGFAGKVPLKPSPGLLEVFDVLLAIGNEPAQLDQALQNTRLNLQRTAQAIGNLMAASRLK